MAEPERGVKTLTFEKATSPGSADRAPMELGGRNWWQSVANPPAANSPKKLTLLLTGCDQLPTWAWA